MRAVLARLFDGVAVGRRVWIREELCRLLIADLGQLEVEEHHVTAALRARLAHTRKQTAGGMVLRVPAVEHVRVDLRLGGGFLIVLELAHHGREGLRFQRRDLALVPRLEILRSLHLARERGFYLRIVRRCEEVAQIPANCFGAC